MPFDEVTENLYYSWPSCASRFGQNRVLQYHDYTACQKELIYLLRSRSRARSRARQALDLTLEASAVVNLAPPLSGVLADE